MIEELDLVTYLVEKGLQVNRAAGPEVTVHCFECADGDTKGRGKLYLNTETWLYQCKRCMASGNRKTLLEHFGDEDGVRHAAGADPMKRRRILAEAADLAHDMLLGNTAMLDYLLNRGIAPELIVSQKLGYVPKNFGLADSLPSRENLTYEDLIGAKLVTLDGRDWFNDSITIPYFSHGTIIQIREKRLDAKYFTPPGDSVHLYNADSLWGADRVLVTEGEIDALSVMTHAEASQERALQSLAVVGLPGATSWPEGLVDMLKTASKVFIGLDSDDTGTKAAAKLKEALGPKARVVKLPAGEPKTDWNDWFLPATPRNPNGGHGWADLRDILTESDLAGKRMFDIVDISTKWSKRQDEAPGLKLGFPTLDAVIRPGLKPGQIVIPLAKSGTGKSAFLSNIVYNLRKHRVLYVSLELTGAEVYEHMRRIHRFWNPKAGREELMADLSLLRITEMNRIKSGDLGVLIGEYTDEIGLQPELLIVDYLQYYARGFRGDQYARVSDAAMEIKAVSKEEELVTIVPSQVSRKAEHGKPLSADDARDSGVIDETGDFVVSLFRPDQMVSRESISGELPQQTGAFNAQLLKSRHGGKGRTFNMKFSNMSLVIVDQMDRDSALRVDQENSAIRQGIHYDDYRARQDEAIAQRVLL